MLKYAGWISLGSLISSIIILSSFMKEKPSFEGIARKVEKKADPAPVSLIVRTQAMSDHNKIQSPAIAEIVPVEVKLPEPAEVKKEEEKPLVKKEVKKPAPKKKEIPEPLKEEVAVAEEAPVVIEITSKPDTTVTVSVSGTSTEAAPAKKKKKKFLFFK
ncbi:MAG: hypothetical protein ACJ75J_04720 [Cytophagaceae bacterium]